MTKRIAVIYRNLAGLSGVPNVVFTQVAALRESGYAVDLLAQKIDHRRAASAGAGAVRIARVPALKNANRRWFSYRADRLGRGYDFVIGHGHHCRQDVLILHNSIRLANERAGAGTDRDPDALVQDRVIGAGRYSVCIANSGLMRDDLIDRYGVPADRIRVVHPGCDTGRFNTDCRVRYRDGMRRDLGIPEDCLLIGLVTSGAFHKRGVDILLNAYARLPDDVRRASRLLIIGRHSPEAQRGLARSLGIDASVMFRPASAEVERYYAALDIGVHPARFEEFGLTVEEMMACGVPVITNRRVGAAELLPPDAYRALPACAEPDSLAADLERFVRDGALRRRWSKMGAAAAAGNSLAVNCSNILAVCREAGL